MVRQLICFYLLNVKFIETNILWPTSRKILMYPKFVDVTCHCVFFHSDSLVKITREKSRERCYKKVLFPFFSFRMTFYKKDIEVNSFNDIFAKQRQSIARKFFSALYTAAAQIT